MSKQLGAVVVAAAFAVVGYKGMAEPQTSVPRLAYINSNAIIAEAPGAAEAQATFDREMARWQTEMQALSDTLQKMIEQYEQQQVMLSPEKRQERQQAIQQKRLDYQKRASDLEQVAQRRQQELVQPVLDRIQTTLMQIRDEGNYTMIFDAAAGSGLIVADTTLNITGQVIERMKASAGQGQDTAN